MVMYGGMVPRRAAQFTCDPAWSFFAFTFGFLNADYAFSRLKYRAKSLIPDPHRFVVTAEQIAHH